MIDIKQKYSANLTADYRFHRGHLRDFSDNANHGSAQGNLIWHHREMQYNVFADGLNAYIDTGADVVGTGELSIIALIHPLSEGEASSGTICQNGKMLFLLRSDGALVLTSKGSGFVNSGTDVLDFSQTHVVGVTRNADGSNTNFYLNGERIGTADQDSGVPEAGTSNLILMASSTGTNNLESHMFEFTMYDTEFSTKDMADAYDQMINNRSDILRPVRYFSFNNVAANSNFASDEAWTKGATWEIDGTHASLDGSQVFTTTLTQSDILQDSTKYFVEFNVENRTAGTITPILGSTNGTGRSGNDTYREYITANGGDFTLSADADWDGDIDYVLVKAGEDAGLAVYEAVNYAVTLGSAIGSGGWGPWHVDSGTWKVSIDDTGKYFECVTDGALKMYISDADDLYTRTFTATGTASLAKASDSLTINASAGEKIRLIDLLWADPT